MKKPKIEINAADGNVIRYLGPLIGVHFDVGYTFTVKDPNYPQKTFYPRQELKVVICKYTCPNGVTPNYYGIIDRKKYDTAIRDSQKFPINWKQYPTLKIEEKRGTVLKIAGPNELTVKEDGKDGKVYFISYDGFDTSYYKEGQRVIINAKYTFISPDGKENVDNLMIPFDEASYDANGDIITPPLPEGGTFNTYESDDNSIGITYTYDDKKVK